MFGKHLILVLLTTQACFKVEGRNEFISSLLSKGKDLNAKDEVGSRSVLNKINVSAHMINLLATKNLKMNKLKAAHLIRLKKIEDETRGYRLKAEENAFLVKQIKRISDEKRRFRDEEIEVGLIENGKECKDDNQCISRYCIEDHSVISVGSKSVAIGRKKSAVGVMRTSQKRCVKCLMDSDCTERNQECVYKRTWSAQCQLSDIKTIPSIDKVTKGYNIYKADPFGKSDPGFSAAMVEVDHVFELTYSPTAKTCEIDGKNFDLPVNYNCDKDVRCHKITETNKLSNTQSFKEQMEKTAQLDFSASYRGVNAKGGVGIKKSEEWAKRSQMHKTTFISTAFCNKYEIKMKYDSKPNLSEGFIRYLTQKFNKITGVKSDVYHDLFDEVGTHIIGKAIFGSRYTIESVLDKSQIDTMHKKANGKTTSVSINVGVMALIDAIYGENHKEEKKLMKQWENESVTTTVIGASAIDLETWQARQYENKELGIIRLQHLRPICYYIPDREEWKDFRKNDCLNMYESYCRKITGRSNCNFEDIQCILPRDCKAKGDYHWQCKNNKCEVDCYKESDCKAANETCRKNQCVSKRYMVEVHVDRAFKLCNRDKHWIGTNSDPFAEVEVEVSKDKSKWINKIERTRTIAEKRNPVWNEELSFGPFDSNSFKWFKISITLFDSDDGGRNKDYLGDVHEGAMELKTKYIKRVGEVVSNRCKFRLLHPSGPISPPYYPINISTLNYHIRVHEE